MCDSKKMMPLSKPWGRGGWAAAIILKTSSIFDQKLVILEVPPPHPPPPKGFAFTFKGACATRYRAFAFKLKANLRHKLALRKFGRHDVVPTPLRYHLQMD